MVSVLIMKKKKFKAKNPSASTLGRLWRHGGRAATRLHYVAETMKAMVTSVEAAGCNDATRKARKHLKARIPSAPVLGPLWRHGDVAKTATAMVPSVQATGCDAATRKARKKFKVKNPSASALGRLWRYGGRIASRGGGLRPAG